VNALEFSAVVALVACGAGFLGALTGLGGGVVIVPLLTFAFHVDLRYAIGASLMSVIATSSGAAAAYVRDGISNVRIGMLLEIATTFGAVYGAYLATIVPTRGIAIVFGCILLFSAAASNRRRAPHAANEKPDALAAKLRLNGSYPDNGAVTPYTVRRVPLGFGMMFGAGTLSGLLGIGSGAVKVLAMDEAMQVPFKVSTTTSNFMIGVTAAASAGIYLSRGYIEPTLAMPVTLGVLLGSLLGARLLVRTKTSVIRIVFAVVIAALGVEMIVNGIRGTI
jgi:uncharacterized membrane protein YfcA